MKMNEELQKALGALLNKANNGIETAGEFLASELPDVIQQLLMWHGVLNLSKAIAAVLILFFIMFCARKVIKRFPKKPPEKDGSENWAYDITRYPSVGDSVSLSGLGFAVGVTLLMLATVLFSISLALFNVEWLQIWIAPKVWLIEYAAKLAN